MNLESRNMKNLVILLLTLSAPFVKAQEDPKQVSFGSSGGCLQKLYNLPGEVMMFNHRVGEDIDDVPSHYFLSEETNRPLSLIAYDKCNDDYKFFDTSLRPLDPSQFNLQNSYYGGAMFLLTHRKQEPKQEIPDHYISFNFFQFFKDLSGGANLK